MEQFYKMWNETQDIKTKIIDRLSKQFNADNSPPTARSHPQLKAAHHTQHVGVTRKSNWMRNIRYSFILTRSEEMMINNEKYVMTSK